LSEAILSKLRSQSLRDAVTRHGAERHSVLVELAAPMPQVVFGPKSKTGAVKPRRILTAPNEETEVRRMRVADLLGEVLGTVPRYSRSAAAFFVEATGAQISKIAESSDVKAIHPNRDIG
jgi:hypothetical protein